MSFIVSSVSPIGVSLCLPTSPEHFLACFEYSDQRDAALRAGSVTIGSTTFLLQPWRLDSFSRASNWPFHVKICTDNLPTHARSAEGVRQVLGDICVFDYMKAATNTTILSFAWMKNPDLLPRSKEVTFFSENAGRSSARDGLPPVDAPLAAPPEGRDATVLIHLDHYYDWTSLPPISVSSEVSGLPSSSGSTESRFFRCSEALLGASGCWTGSRERA
jgi:hypothetical protein